MQKTYTPSQSLIDDMKDTRRTFSEAGYLIFDPAPQYVRSPHDFVAIEKITGRQLVLVRVGEYETKTQGTKERIEVRRYSRHDYLSLFIKKVRTRIKNNIRQRQVLPIVKEENYYTRFIAEDQHEEAAYTFPKSSYRW